VTMAAGLRATAKAVEQPPEPKVGAPVLDPTTEPHTTCSSPKRAHKKRLEEAS